MNDETTSERAVAAAHALVDIAGPEGALAVALVIAQGRKDDRMSLAGLPRSTQDRLIALFAEALAAADRGDHGLHHRIFVAVARLGDQALVLLTHREAEVLARHVEEGLDNPFDGDPEEDEVARVGLMKLRSAVANLLLRRPTSC